MVGEPKKVESRPSASKELPSKTDFLKWLDDYVSRRDVKKLDESARHLPTEYRVLATELLIALKDPNARPSAKFKIDRLSDSFFRVFASASQNMFFQIFILCDDRSSATTKELVLASLGKAQASKDTLEYLLKRLASIKDLHTKERLWNMIISGGLVQSEGWISEQLSILEWGIQQDLRIFNPVETLIALREASNHFRESDESRQRKIIRKLFTIDLLTTVAFCLHVATSSSNIKILVEVIDGKEDLFISSYFSNRGLLQGNWLEDFESRLIAPILKSRLDSIMSFADLLPLIVYSQRLESFLPPDLLARVVARSFKKEDALANLLADKRVLQLESQVESLTEERDQFASRLSAETLRADSSQDEVKKLEAAIESFENRLRLQMKTENVGSDALAQNAKVGLLKSIIEGVDHLFSAADGLLLERAFQKLGVQRLGAPGDSYSWDSATCETLTGEPITTGVVVRSGYTWLESGKKIMVRRVLLKKG